MANNVDPGARRSGFKPQLCPITAAWTWAHPSASPCPTCESGMSLLEDLSNEDRAHGQRDVWGRDGHYCCTQMSMRMSTRSQPLCGRHRDGNLQTRQTTVSCFPCPPLPRWQLDGRGPGGCVHVLPSPVWGSVPPEGWGRRWPASQHPELHSCRLVLLTLPFCGGHAEGPRLGQQLPGPSQAGAPPSPSAQPCNRSRSPRSWSPGGIAQVSADRPCPVFLHWRCG